MGREYRPWTAAERLWLKDNWGKLPRDKVCICLNRTVGVVQAAVVRFGLSRKRNYRRQDVNSKLRKWRTLIVEQHAKGLSDLAIGRMIGMDSRHVTKYRRLTLKLPDTCTKAGPHGDHTKLLMSRSQTARRLKDRKYAHAQLGTTKGEEGQGVDRRIYDDEESEYLKAVSQFRKQTQRIPTLEEGFRIALSLGWSKG